MAIWIQSGRERGGGGGAKRFGPVSVRYTSPPDMQFGIKRGGSHTRTPRGGGGRCRHIQRNSLNNSMYSVGIEGLFLLEPNRHTIFFYLSRL